MIEIAIEHPNMEELRCFTQEPEQDHQVTESEEEAESELYEQSYFDKDKLNQSFSDDDLVDTTMREKHKLRNKLPLPSHMKHLYNLFCSLDTYLSLLKRRRLGEWQVTLSDLSQMVEHSLHRNFREEHFCRILTVCPEFFVHKWEMKNQRMELYIEVPAEIIQILEGEHCLSKESEKAYPYPLDESTLQARRLQFNQELSAMCYEYFQAQQYEQDDASCYDTQSIQNWPDFFNIEDVPQVVEAELKERPAIVHKSESVSSYLHKHDIRSSVEIQLAQREPKEIDDNLSQASYQLSQSGVSQDNIRKIVAKT